MNSTTSRWEALVTAQLYNCFTEIAIPGYEMEIGKVRTSCRLAKGKRLIVATDRLSAFDKNLTEIPFQGQILNDLTVWWLNELSNMVGHHLISVPDENSMVVKDLHPLPVEFVVRGAITGVTKTSLWTLYNAGERTIYGIKFPNGLRKNELLPEPVATPTTKAIKGQHDTPLTRAMIAEYGIMDLKLYDRITAIAIAIFKRGQNAAAQRGLFLVDTKYEFAYDQERDEVILIDEVHTPHSSRFWEQANYNSILDSTGRPIEGQEPDSWDKEHIRRWYAAQGYKGEGEPPVLLDSVRVQTALRFIQVYEGLTGRAFQPATYPAVPRILANLRKTGILAA